MWFPMVKYHVYIASGKLRVYEVENHNLYGRWIKYFYGPCSIAMLNYQRVWVCVESWWIPNMTQLSATISAFVLYVLNMFIWGFPRIGVPQNGWFPMKNPSINGWFSGNQSMFMCVSLETNHSGYPHSWKPPYQEQACSLSHRHCQVPAIEAEDLTAAVLRLLDLGAGRSRKPKELSSDGSLFVDEMYSFSFFFVCLFVCLFDFVL